MSERHEAAADPPDNALLQFVWRGLQVSIESKLQGGRGLTEEEARAILEPIESKKESA